MRDEIDDDYLRAELLKKKEMAYMSNLNIPESQRNALEYIKTFKIDRLFSEMLNSVVHSNAKDPLIYMIKYLAKIADPEDIAREKIQITELDNISPQPIIKDFVFPNNSASLLKNFLAPEIYDKLKTVKTSLGGHISHIIDSGMKADNKENVGIFATDGEAYTKFSPLFKSAVEDTLHKYDRSIGLFDISEHVGILSIPKLGIIKDKLHGIKMKYARNLKFYPYLPYAHLHTRKEICENILSAVSKVECGKGTFYDLESIIKNEDLEKKLNIFYDKDESFFNTFPDYSFEHSGIYVTEDSTVAYIINFNDHLQIVVYDNTLNFKKTYDKLFSVHRKIEDELQFDQHPFYGYLTSCPSNIGRGLKLSAWLSIPNAVEHSGFNNSCIKWSIRQKKNNNQAITAKGVSEIISKHKLGIPEISFVNSFLVKTCSLIALEQKLLDDPNYTERILEHSKFKRESLKSLYNHYFEKYRYITTPNLIAFNQLFNYDPIKQNYSVLLQDKESYHIFRDFIFDYITTNTHTTLMVTLTKKENFENLKKIYQEQIPVEKLEAFDQKKDLGNIKKGTMIFRRNMKHANFNASLTYEQLRANYENFLELAKRLEREFGGKSIDASNMRSLTTTDFKIYLDEYESKGKGIEKGCAYASSNDKVLVLLNGINHIKLISFFEKGQISQAYSDVIQILNFIESKLSLEYDDMYGYLACTPLNCGSSFEVRLLFEDLSKENIEEYRALADKVDLSSVNILSSQLEVYNKAKINTSQAQVITKFIELLNEIEAKYKK